VTGYDGTVNHRGNAFGQERDNQVQFSPSDQRPKELANGYDSKKYLTTTSDILALLIFEHQSAMHNSLTRAGQRTRRALQEPPAEAGSANEREAVLAAAAEDVVDHLLFRNAAPLPNGIPGADAFRAAFARDARRTSNGDALKDLSLRGRLFVNRCSFLIYSESFAALPRPLKDRIFARLYAALRSDDPKSQYSYLEPEEKRRIYAVLNQTLPDAERSFRQLTP
jgi:hypothetical protein